MKSPLHVLSNCSLCAQNEVELGELLLSLNYLPSAGRLNVDIIRAKQLLQTDMCQGSGNVCPSQHITRTGTGLWYVYHCFQ